MKVVKLLDSFAMLAYLNGEQGCEKICEALALQPGKGFATSA